MSETEQKFPEWLLYQSPLERERAELMVMPCETIEEALAVSSRMRRMLTRYGQEACTGIPRPDQESPRTEKERLQEVAYCAWMIWRAWNRPGWGLANKMHLLRDALKSAGFRISPEARPNPYLAMIAAGEKSVEIRRHIEDRQTDRTEFYVQMEKDGWLK